MKLPRLPPLSIASSKHTSSVCKSCIRNHTPSSPATSFQTTRQQRSFATSSPPPPPPTAGYTLLPTRRLISLHGPDTTKFLQGLITANISNRSSGFYTSFLNGQGRLLHDVFIYPDGKPNSEGEGGWLIEIDANEAVGFAKYIKRYKLRAKVEVRLVDEGEMGVWSLWDEESGWTAHSLGGSTTSGETKEVGCEDHRAPGMGKRLILPAGKRPEVDVQESNEEAYRIRRYLRGVPEGQDELLREQALPQESNIDFMGGIDYRKGCYVGQELTIRTHHTGVVRKRVLPVMIYGAEDTQPDTLEYSSGGVGGIDASAIPRETNFGRAGKKGRSAGKWLRGVGNLGLGLCRIEIMTDAVVQGGSGGFKEGDEFKLEWEVEGVEGGNTVKAKAFVPEWHLTRQKVPGKG